MKIKKYILIACFLVFSELPAKSADKIIIYKGSIGRSISVSSLESLAKHKKATGTLKNIIKLSGENKNDIADMLNEEYELPIVLTSNLMNSKIGTIILSRVGQIIYPDKTLDDSISIPAIRAGVINGIVEGNGKLSLIRFFKSYPNKNMAINYGALSKVIKKVNSMTDLVEFFTGSPLEKLKNNSPV
tara:strand:+ start:13730 stop:14290 length:561 start_codon:yes stop_codon:yes gene_type:complete